MVAFQRCAQNGGKLRTGANFTLAHRPVSQLTLPDAAS